MFSSCHYTDCCLMEQYIERSWRFHFILIFLNQLKNYCCLNWKSLKSEISFLAMFLPRIPLVRKKKQVQNWMPQYFVKAEIYLYKTVCCFLYFNTGNLQMIPPVRSVIQRNPSHKQPWFVEELVEEQKNKNWKETQTV